MSGCFLNETLLLGVVGSRAYGMYTSNSDEDVKGVCFGPVDSYVGFKSFEQYEDPNVDYVVYELRKFCRLALNANPTVLEVLFLNNYKHKSASGELLLNNRHLFLSQKVKQTYTGYAASELKQAKGHKNESKKLAHCLRLLRSGLELFQTGFLQVDRTSLDAEELLDVRLGRTSPLKVEAMCSDLLKSFDELVTSPLPKEPDTVGVEKMVRGLLLNYLTSFSC